MIAKIALLILVVYFLNFTRAFDPADFRGPHRITRGVVIGDDQNIHGHIKSERNEDVIIGRSSRKSSKHDSSERGDNAPIGNSNKPKVSMTRPRVGTKQDIKKTNNFSSTGINIGNNNKSGAQNDDRANGGSSNRARPSQRENAPNSSRQPASGYNEGITIGNRNTIRGGITAHL